MNMLNLGCWTNPSWTSMANIQKKKIWRQQKTQKRKKDTGQKIKKSFPLSWGQRVLTQIWKREKARGLQQWKHVRAWAMKSGEISYGRDPHEKLWLQQAQDCYKTKARKLKKRSQKKPILIRYDTKKKKKHTTTAALTIYVYLVTKKKQSWIKRNQSLLDKRVSKLCYKWNTTS